MASNPCPCMKLQTGVKVICMTDIGISAIFIFMIASVFVDLAFNINDTEQMKHTYGEENPFTFGFILGLLIVGVLFGTQLISSIHLYMAARNDNLSRGFLPWLVATIGIILFIFLAFIWELLGAKVRDLLFSLLIINYKTYAMLVLLSFKRSMVGREQTAVYDSLSVGQGKSGGPLDAGRAPDV
ncbi:unnamed protein product [Orchesella dallaii]|uniref:Uncharacterized protein n=1 Tax=Orchesella dallaii TaxID=48710 RepID=A0ABP1RI99_9HEXA